MLRCWRWALFLVGLWLTTAVSVRSALAEESPADSAAPCRRGREILLEYLQLYKLVPPGREKDDATFGDPSDYVIGIVPDPQIAGHEAYFEAALEGIEDAVAEGEGGVRYVRDRAFLPWRRGERKKAARRCSADEPGVIVFRPPQPTRDRPKIVLLVGETPTWGVRVKQLDAAITLASGTDPNASPLRILGPTFSGSASSLAATLESRGVYAYIVSGTAMQPDLGGTFKDVAQFSSVVPNAEELLRTMLDYVDVRGAVVKGDHYTNVALVSESLTAYGTAIRESSGQPTRDKTLDPTLRFYFPALRGTRLEDAPASTPPEAKDDDEDGDGSKKKEARSSSEEPKRTPAAAPTPEALVFDEVARELSRRRVRFVGVVATNASDVITLITRLRSSLPDVRFFTLGAHIEYQDPSSADVLNGMLVAHAGVPDDWGDKSVTLRNALVRNVFLAGRRLLGDVPPEGRPRARVSMIGNGALWGLDEAKGARDAPVSWWFVFGGAMLVFLTTVGVVNAPSWTEKHRWLWRGTHMGLVRHRGPVWLLIGRCEHTDLRADDDLVTAALLSLAGSAPLLMCMALWARKWTSCGTWLCALGVLVVFGTSWYRVLAEALSRRRERRSAPWSGSRAAVLFSALASIAAGFALAIGCRPADEATLNLMSGGSSVLAGLTGFGMIWLGLWCWRVRLRFLDMHRFGAAPGAKQWHTPPIAQALGQTLEAGDDVAALEHRLLRVLRSPWLSFAAVPASIHLLLAITVLAIVTIRAPAAFEPAWRNQLVVACGLLSLLPITGNFSRIIATWVVLIRLLRRLGKLPMLDALRTLPGTLARDLEGQLTLATADVGELYHLVDALQRIAARDASFEAAAEEATRLWDAEMRREAGVTLEGDRESGETTAPRARLVDLLLDASGRLTPRRDELNDKMTALADELLALILAVFIPRYIRHFRLFVPPVILGSALGVLMTSLYFVQPQTLITTAISLWVFGMVIVVYGVYASLDRDAVVSALGNTKEGSVELDWNLVWRIVTLAAVPIASLFAARYPGFSYWVSTLVNGVEKTIR